MKQAERNLRTEEASACSFKTVSAVAELRGADSCLGDLARGDAVESLDNKEVAALAFALSWLPFFLPKRFFRDPLRLLSSVAFL